MKDERDDIFDDEDYEENGEYEGSSIGDILFGVVMTAIVIAVVAGLCVASYTFGYHKQLSSDEMRQLAYDTIYDGRTKNGDVIEKSYMPEGGFTFDSDTMMLSECYKETTLDGTFYLLSNDGEFLRHLKEKYPEALYPSNEWTVEGVLDFYRNSLESWAYYDSAYLEGKGYYICCTPDYKHCFAVKDDQYTYGEGTETGWLIIDGVYVTVIDEKFADSLEPDVLLAQYRDGTWDGELIRSKDYGTVAWISYNQTEIYYSYERRIYSERQDPLGLAYDGYENPWWYDDTLAEKYGVEKYHETIRDFGYESTIWLKCYPDLPGDFDLKQIKETEDLADGTLAVLLTDGRLQRYSRTELLGEWDLSEMSRQSLDDDYFCQVKEPFSLNDEMYYLDGDKLYALKTGGEVRLMLENIGAVDHSYSLRGSSILVLEEDGLLCCYDIYEGRIYVIDRDVLEMNFGEIMAYRKADGYYALYRLRIYEEGPDYATLYLGEESLEYYLEYRKNLWKTEWRDY